MQASGHPLRPGRRPPRGRRNDLSATDVAGPHHTHPNGEIDLHMPLGGDATFDGRPAGWVVMPPGSAHRPTVRAGRALVLYLLPLGAIEFTK